MLAPAAADTNRLSTDPSLSIVRPGESDDGYALQEDNTPQQGYALQQAYAPQADATPQPDEYSTEFLAGHVPGDEVADLTGPYVRTKRRKSNSAARTIVNLVAHLTSSVLGLSLGYYILCWMRPESNFLHLNLPLLPPAVTETSANPGTPPTAPQNP